MKRFNDRKRSMGTREVVQMRPDLEEDQEQHLTVVSEPARTDGGKDPTSSIDRGYIPTDDFGVGKRGIKSEPGAMFLRRNKKRLMPNNSRLDSERNNFTAGNPPAFDRRKS